MKSAFITLRSCDSKIEPEIGALLYIVIAPRIAKGFSRSRHHPYFKISISTKRFQLFKAVQIIGSSLDLFETITISRGFDCEFKDQISQSREAIDKTLFLSTKFQQR